MTPQPSTPPHIQPSNPNRVERPDAAEIDRRLQSLDDAIEAELRDRMDENATFAHFFSNVECHCANGVLTVRGQVPTEGLKRVLWRFIGEFDELADVEDRLDVVSSNGLSNICSECDDLPNGTAARAQRFGRA